ncbi:MAG: YraN family protein [Peptococcaceae bacterium]|nr:YraN family protein [Peptococcaceae bacterium]
MTHSRLILGRTGEKIALSYLKKSGLKLVESNFRCPLGELDIIARDKNYLVFIEVRTVSGVSKGKAQESIGIKKQKKIKQLALMYLSLHNLRDIPVRFDVIAINIDPIDSSDKIEYIPNAF